jgi:hypothetical protein
VTDAAPRIYRVKGSPREAGLALGRALGERLAQNVERYIETGPARHGSLDRQRPRSGALPWLRSLPQRYQEEFEGMAEGSGVSLQRLAEWCFVEECAGNGCSALVCLLEGSAWVARNNDIWAPDLWGYVTVREIDGRIPTMGFGLEGELFTGTGVNGQRLWLHYNWLPLRGTPASGKSHLACFVWLTEALETCRTVADVEALLRAVARDGSMMLFVADGKSDEFAVFECTCAEHFRREPSGGWLAGTNHYVTGSGRTAQEEPAERSVHRLQRMEELLADLYRRGAPFDLPWDLVRILADEGVEVRGEDYGTVYANVACPGRGIVWYTFGGYPAASAGAWRRVEWSWQGG